MYVISKYINAVIDAIDFIYGNTDGACEGHQELDTLSVLRELVKKMNDSQHKQLVGYYLKKHKKQLK